MFKKADEWDGGVQPAMRVHGSTEGEGYRLLSSRLQRD